jgi:D-alanyl-D-alanine carboxypeptidase/D-alanyl-D-alanine-endopeptidase (penicillin-binding protein 4)
MVDKLSGNRHTSAELNDGPVARAFPALDRMSVGIFAREQETGRIIADHNATLPLPPASNTKLITTALALDRLGPDYRFEIRGRRIPNSDPNPKPNPGPDSYPDSDPNSYPDSATGSLDPVVLWSDRSPVVDVDDLSRLAEAMRDSGISAIGDIAIDVSGHDGQEYGPGWTWNDEQHYYGAKITPIAVSGNVVEMSISGVANGDGNKNEDDNVDNVSVVAEPNSSIVELSCALELADGESKTDGTDNTEEENEIEAFRRHDSNQIRITGRVAPGETHCVKLPVVDPLQHAGDVFGHTLDQAGIDVNGEVRIVSELALNGNEYDEWSIESPPLSEIIRTMNHPSDNFIAEQLALAVARQNTETGIGSSSGSGSGCGSWEEWETLVREFLEARGVRGYRLRDGSGLSRYNRISSYGLATVVDWAVDQPWSGAFLDSLPVAGRDGTLSDRLGEIEPTIRAKTGSLTGTRTLTGIIEREEKTTITVSAMVSNLTGEHESRGTEYLDTFVRNLIAREQ